MTHYDRVEPVALLNAALRLTAVPNAVGISRMFVRHNLERWKLEGHTDDASLIMSELVTNAVKASGITEPNPKPWQIKAEHVIGVQLRAMTNGLYVEVWDRIEAPPVMKSGHNLVAESGRGLLLVDQLAMRWNVYRPHTGGKVVWAQLALPEVVELPPFESAHSPLRLPTGARAVPGPTDDLARTALCDRLLETTVAAAVARVNART
ncbi:ATP-binding protein [Streptomyces cadmiisoli]|uniref:ATP-binding protein n=1 Tax=Streptomyces cadmiisoli TaxID=2184053 RepID=UPI003666C9D9